MYKRHQILLSSNHDFLVSEIPMDATLEAIRGKRVLTWHDFEQIRTLRHQGRRAIARYFLAMLPHRGSGAFQAFLESLQEANAQHLVDLLLQQAGASSLEDLCKPSTPGTENDDVRHKGPAKTPTDTPLPPGPDPHEYAVKLTRNAKFIREFVDPAHISPLLAQNKVLTEREADMVVHLNGRNKKWDLIMAVLLQRGERAYQAFMAALLQKDYSSVFHAIQETSAEPSGSDTDDSLSDRDIENKVESDEEIKQEATKYMQRNSLDDDLLRDSTSSAADNILLKRSRDLINIKDDFRHTPSRSVRNGTSQHVPDINARNSVDSRASGNGNFEYSDVKDRNGINKRSRGQSGTGSNSNILNSLHEDIEY